MSYEKLKIFEGCNRQSQHDPSQNVTPDKISCFAPIWAHLLPLPRAAAQQPLWNIFPAVRHFSSGEFIKAQKCNQCRPYLELGVGKISRSCVRKYFCIVCSGECWRGRGAQRSLSFKIENASISELHCTVPSLGSAQKQSRLQRTIFGLPCCHASYKIIRTSRLSEGSRLIIEFVPIVLLSESTM